MTNRVKDYLESSEALDNAMLDMFGHKPDNRTKVLVKYYEENDPREHYKWVWPDEVEDEDE